MSLELIATVWRHHRPTRAQRVRDLLFGLSLIDQRPLPRQLQRRHARLGLGGVLPALGRVRGHLPAPATLAAALLATLLAHDEPIPRPARHRSARTAILSRSLSLVWPALPRADSLQHGCDGRDRGGWHGNGGRDCVGVDGGEAAATDVAAGVQARALARSAALDPVRHGARLPLLAARIGGDDRVESGRGAASVLLPRLCRQRLFHPTAEDGAWLRSRSGPHAHGLDETCASISPSSRADSHAQSEHKIQSGKGSLVLEMDQVPKILRPLVEQWSSDSLIVSFKARLAFVRPR